MRVVHKAIIEEPGPIWDVHRDEFGKKIKLDRFGSISIGKERFFIDTIRRTRPYKRHRFLPAWGPNLDEDEIYFCVSGSPTSIPPIHEFKEMNKIEEHAEFSSQQMELLAREKETGMYLHQAVQWIWLIAGLGLGTGIGAIAMYALSKWQG